MPKVKAKTHSGASKRFKATKSKKIKALGSAFTGHDIQGTKTTKQKRQARKNSYLAPGDAKRIKRMINEG